MKGSYSNKSKPKSVDFKSKFVDRENDSLKMISSTTSVPNSSMDDTLRALINSVNKGTQAIDAAKKEKARQAEFLRNL